MLKGKVSMIYQYQAGHSLFHQIDPISKFIWLVGVSLIALLLDTGWTQLFLLLVIIVIGNVLAGLSLHEIWRGMRIPFWFGLPYFLLQLLFLPGETELLRLGSFVLSTEAIDYAAAITLRFVTLVLASLLYIASTDPRHVVLALAQKLKVPYRFAFAISIALRFLPILEEEAALIRSAQRMRGMGKPEGLRNQLYWWKSFVISIFIHAVRRVGQIAAAMDTKGFGVHRKRTYLHKLEITSQGISFAVISALLTIGATVTWILL
jgi:energy-coupling factor transport system permease protein